ncbi:MAG: KTSC domain-containing protein [Rhodocyclaceae bacterium]|nr:KTSC domain-containing protein [Rhodocyclaceae bacterium]
MSSWRPLCSGPLRAACYDEQTQTLQIEFDDGSRKAYAPIALETWRRLLAAPSPWSYFRECIAEEIQGRTLARAPKSAPKKNPLDDLFS